MNVSIIGSGNVGNAIGTVFAINGHCVLFHDVVYKHILIDAQFTTNFKDAFDFGDALIICVPTELNDQAQCDLTIFEAVCRQFGECQRSAKNKHKKLLVQKSTCLPGTASSMIGMLESQYGLKNGKDYHYAVFPSFLNMGQPIRDELVQKKCLIGVDYETGIEVTERLKLLMHWASPIFSSYINVELAKYVNNIFHASILSIWNEIFVLGQKLGADTDWLAKVTTQEAGLESIYRVHGMAWGGPCLPKDTQAFLNFGKEFDLELKILKSVVEVNDEMRSIYGTRVEHWPELMKQKKP